MGGPFFPPRARNALYNLSSAWQQQGPSALRQRFPKEEASVFTPTDELIPARHCGLEEEEKEEEEGHWFSWCYPTVGITEMSMIRQGAAPSSCNEESQMTYESTSR